MKMRLQNRVGLIVILSSQIFCTFLKKDAVDKFSCNSLKCDKLRTLFPLPKYFYSFQYFTKKSSKDFKGMDTTKAAIEASKKSKVE